MATLTSEVNVRRPLINLHHLKPGPTDVTYSKWTKVVGERKTVGGETVWLKYAIQEGKNSTVDTANSEGSFDFY